MDGLTRFGCGLYVCSKKYVCIEWMKCCAAKVLSIASLNRIAKCGRLHFDSFFQSTHTVCQSIRQSNYSFFPCLESIFTLQSCIFSAECSVKSACSSISIDCVKQSSSVHRTAHILICSGFSYEFVYFVFMCVGLMVCLYVSPWTSRHYLTTIMLKEFLPFFSIRSFAFRLFSYLNASNCYGIFGSK